MPSSNFEKYERDMCKWEIQIARWASRIWYDMIWEVEVFLMCQEFSVLKLSNFRASNWLLFRVLSWFVPNFSINLIIYFQLFKITFSLWIFEVVIFANRLLNNNKNIAIRYFYSWAFNNQHTLHLWTVTNKIK